MYTYIKIYIFQFLIVTMSLLMLPLFIISIKEFMILCMDCCAIWYHNKWRCIFPAALIAHARCIGVWIKNSLLVMKVDSSSPVLLHKHENGCWSWQQYISLCENRIWMVASQFSLLDQILALHAHMNNLWLQLLQPCNHSH